MLQSQSKLARMTLPVWMEPRHDAPSGALWLSACLLGLTLGGTASGLLALAGQDAPQVSPRWDAPAASATAAQGSRSRASELVATDIGRDLVSQAPRQTAAAGVVMGPSVEEIQQRATEVARKLAFNRNSSDLDGASIDALTDFAGWLRTAAIALTVSGHTDSRGSPDLNAALSSDRAQAVRHALLKAGLEGSRVIAVGKGSDLPIATNETSEGRAKNRRIEILVSRTPTDLTSRFQESSR